MSGRKVPSPVPDPIPPWVPVPFGQADAAALRALAAGLADRDQQMRALRWIVEEAAAVYQPTHYPQNDDRCFANGRRSVGLRLVAIINMPADLLAKMAEEKK